MTSVELKGMPPEADTLVKAQRLLTVTNMEETFRLEGSDVVVELQLDKQYLSLDRTFSVFATVRVDNGDSKWRLGFDYPEAYLQGVTVVQSQRNQKRGAREFLQFAAQFHAAGFLTVVTDGVRFPAPERQSVATEFGYNALPKWGFDGPIPSLSKSRLTGAQRDLTTVRELLDQVNGSDIWKDVGMTTNLSFDLRDGSRSWQILSAYLASSLHGI